MQKKDLKTYDFISDDEDEIFLLFLLFNLFIYCIKNKCNHEKKLTKLKNNSYIHNDLKIKTKNLKNILTGRKSEVIGTPKLKKFFPNKNLNFISNNSFDNEGYLDSTIELDTKQNELKCCYTTRNIITKKSANFNFGKETNSFLLDSEIKNKSESKNKINQYGFASYLDKESLNYLSLSQNGFYKGNENFINVNSTKNKNEMNLKTDSFNQNSVTNISNTKNSSLISKEKRLKSIFLWNRAYLKIKSNNSNINNIN